MLPDEPNQLNPAKDISDLGVHRHIGLGEAFGPVQALPDPKMLIKIEGVASLKA